MLLAGCGGLQQQAGRTATDPGLAVPHDGASLAKRNEVVLFALALIDTGYRFGGKNPEAGLDCSGMVSYIFEKAVELKLGGSAADIARIGRPVELSALQSGDLVFFNTRNQHFSHVGIYIGDGRFVHAPSTAGRVRADSLQNGWFAARFEAARTLFD
jgi:cell wall-associated NlpC family hydrolase